MKIPSFYLSIILCVIFVFLGIISIFFCFHNIWNYNGVPVSSYKVIKVYPHDIKSYTQGLVFEEDFLYEGAGRTRRRHARLSRVEVETGKVLQKAGLPRKYFGEGIALFGARIFQLTHCSNIGFVYDKKTFRLLKTFYYPTKGWGLTNDRKNLIMSDGTSSLYFIDPETFKKVRQIDVYDGVGPVRGLNELEYINGRVFANVLPGNLIAIIDPKNGKVEEWINMSGVLSFSDRFRGVNILNGIAFDAKKERLFITGKLWPKLFEIKLLSWQQDKYAYIKHSTFNHIKMAAQDILIFVARPIRNLFKNLCYNSPI
ncbi:MAG: glutaminyl-peptide cyclotransferase [Candidatus Saganbacteria bacterium]|nr:glutaminyl-peptide cyclotransferase [Candidatus Saganbacteria bacterium]